MEGHSSSSSDACLQKQRGVRSQSAQQQQTHTHTHITTPHSITASFFSTSSLSLSSRPSVLPPLTPSFSFSLPLPGAHRHPCAVRAISAASGHSNKHKQQQQRSEARPSVRCVSARPTFPFASAPLVSAERACVGSACACLCLPTICLPARSRAAACCSSLSVDVHHHHCRPQWTRGRHALQTVAPRSPFSQHCLPVCVTALPCLALLDRTCRARESTLSPPHSDRHSRTQPVSQSSVSCTKTVSCSLDQAATSATTSPESSARAGPDISYLLAVASSARSPPPPPVTSSTSPHLRQSRLHHPATPPPTTTRQPLTNPSPVDDLFT